MGLSIVGISSSTIYGVHLNDAYNKGDPRAILELLEREVV